LFLALFPCTALFLFLFAIDFKHGLLDRPLLFPAGLRLFLLVCRLVGLRDGWSSTLPAKCCEILSAEIGLEVSMFRGTYILVNISHPFDQTRPAQQMTAMLVET
jgi:hypothetical protein